MKELNVFTHQIYEAATNFELWSEIIENLAAFMQASSIVFLSVNKNKPDLIYSKFLHYVDTGRRLIYASGRFNNYDQYSMSLVEREGEIIHSANVLSKMPVELYPTDVGSDFFRRFGYEYRVGFALSQGFKNHICFYLNRSVKDGDFEDIDRVKRQLDYLYPHIKRSLQISELLSHNNDIISSLSDGLLFNETGIVLLNENAVPFFTNNFAGKFCRENPVIELSESSIKLSLPELNTRLQGYIKSSLLAINSGGEYPGGALRVHENTSGDYFDILVYPIKQNHLVSTNYRRTRVAVLISKPNNLSIPGEMLTLFYGFTGAESEVAIDLLNNLSLNEISQHRDTGYETTKSQIKNIMQKLGVKKQAAVVNEILRGPLKHMAAENNACSRQAPNSMHRVAAAKPVVD